MIRARALALLAGLACASAAPASGHDAAPVPALDFAPPAPGTYTLHRIMAAPDGEVLGLDGRPQRLSHFTRGRISVLGFIYTTCVDPDGCPLAYRVFETVRETLGASPDLRDKVRLVTLSFDPARDSPSAMRAYAGSHLRAGTGAVPWYFLTTRSARALLPLVEGFGQDIRYTVDRSSGRPRRELSHVLKVFLIEDGRQRAVAGALPAACERRSGDVYSTAVASRIEALGSRHVLTLACDGTHSLYLAPAQPVDVVALLGQPLCARYRYVDQPRAPLPCLRPPCPDRERVLELIAVRPAPSPDAVCALP